jgi:thioredoxin-dependent peroxiredoxin
MLKVGEIAPEIRAVTTDGSTFVLSKQAGLCTIVYFYPRAFTPNCTTETRRFRDNYTELTLAGASIVGVSTDDGKTQCRFAEEMRTPFPLIADHDKAISAAYDVLWPLLGMAKRVTYIIGADRTVLAQFRHELQVAKHRDEVLRFVHERLTAMRKR